MAVADDPSAHPKARGMAAERLQVLWTGMGLGERRSFAARAPRAMWGLVWKIRDTGVIESFLQHPRLGLETLVGFIQSPILPTHLDALASSKWREIQPVAHQVLVAMDRSFAMPECPLVLGQAAPWIKVLDEGERILAASRLTHPALRRMTRSPRNLPLEGHGQVED